MQTAQINLAHYTTQTIPEYANNPLLEALPPIMDDDEVIKMLYSQLSLSMQEKNMSLVHKGHILWRLKSFLMPLPVHVKIADMLDKMIRRSYIARNPRSASYVKNLQSLLRLREQKIVTVQDLNGQPTFLNPTADCGLINGISGAGKTTIVKKILAFYPQVIRHEYYHGRPFSRTQIVWLSIDCPHDGSFISLCRSIFLQIDLLTGSKWCEKYGYLTRSESTIIMHLTTLLTNYCVGIIVIDEIQHLTRCKKDVSEMLDFFVSITNMFSVPILFIGTNNCRTLYQNNFRLTRRIASGGQIEMGRLQQNSDDWLLFVSELWRFNLLAEDIPFNGEVAEAFYDSCQGVISLAILLYICAQKNALINRQGKLTVSIIKEALRVDLQIVKPVIDALKSDNPLLIAKFDDIHLMENEILTATFNEFELQKRINQVIDESILKVRKQFSTLKERVTEKLLASGLFKAEDYGLIARVVDSQISQSRSDILEDELQQNSLCEIMQKIGTTSNSHRKHSPKMKKTGDTGILAVFQYALKNKSYPYDELKRHGFIKPPFEDNLC